VYSVLSHRWQNWFLLGASYFFYGFWDLRFLALLVLSTVIDFWCGLKIDQTNSRTRRNFLILSLVSNLSILGFFKYFNFFSESLLGLLAQIGLKLDPLYLDIVLPVGISFYTFQAISYSVDVYRRKLPACRRLDDFALFVCFFPQLVAGPIERASSLLPQIYNKRTINQSLLAESFWFLLFGFFQKVVIADNLAPYVQTYRHDSAMLSGGELGVGFYIMVLFLYSDFSGYSNIARGCAGLLGFDISQNFRMPLFAKNPADFWRRWHITLSDWFRDYVFFTLVRYLGRYTRKKWMMALAAFFTLVLCGLWHGASWNFVVFGTFHGLLLVAYYSMRPLLRRKAVRRVMTEGVFHWLGRVGMFHLLSIPVVFFIIPKPNDWRAFYTGIFAGRWDSAAYQPLMTMVVFALPLLLVDLLQEHRKDILAVRKLSTSFRTVIYSILFTYIVLAGATKTNEFVYFQF
jgi:D-alanyl-lipoteichoic acid acyltransferase DltB (MBOAT superfamily)